MTGFEPRTSGIGSNRSTNWATTTAQKLLFPMNYADLLSLVFHGLCQVQFILQIWIYDD